MPNTFECGVVTPLSRPQSEAILNPDAICTDANSTKWIRINIHFMNYSNGTGNFNAKDDGNGNTGMNGYKRAEILINECNAALANNQQMWRPGGNSTPVNPIRVRYLLSGVYFHNSDYWIKTFDGTGGSPNISNLNAIYGINTSTEINYYYTRSVVNGVELAGNGVAELDGNAGISSSYLSYLSYPNYLPVHVSLQNHEVGHLLSLYHTWNEEDGCTDTPRGPFVNGIESQCYWWSPDPNNPCNNWSNVSNNVMDYNNWQNAYTPCQIGFIQNHLNTWGNQYVHSCNGCDPVNAFFDLSGCYKVAPISNPPSTYSPGQELYLNGEASVNENQYKIEICEVASLGSPTCTGGYYNSGWWNGQIGTIDLKGIYDFSPNKYYKVDLAVASTSCPGVSNMTKYFRIISGTCYTMGFKISTHPNPANTVLNIKYKMEEGGDMDISLFDSIGNIVKSTKQIKSYIGDNESTLETNNLREGMYILVLKSGGKVEKKTIYVNH